MEKFKTADGREFYVAPSYQSDRNKVSGDVFFNSKGKLSVKLIAPCSRCSGTGIFHIYGTCFRCGGGGTETAIVRAYTEKEYAALQKAAAKRAEAKEAKEKARLDDAIANADTYKAEIAKKLGFGDDLCAYSVYGDDTFVIKDRLKEMGARFSPAMKWYFANEIELPEGYFLCKISFDEVFEYKPLAKRADYREDAQEIVNKKIAELKGPSTSEFYPAHESTRIRNITAKVSKVSGFAGVYGYTHVYTFTSENYVFVWMTTAQQQCSVGDLVDLTGTIKKFDEYMGDKITHLSRCKLIKIN